MLSYWVAGAGHHHQPHSLRMSVIAHTYGCALDLLHSECWVVSKKGLIPPIEPVGLCSEFDNTSSSKSQLLVYITDAVANSVHAFGLSLHCTVLFQARVTTCCADISSP